MKPTPLTTALVIEDEEVEEWDRLDALDVYFPNPQSGESEIAFRLRLAFEIEGYRVRRVELALTHPVVIVRAVHIDASRITDQRLLLRCIHDLLRRAGFQIRLDELTVARSGHRVLIAFQTGKWVPNFEEILREPQEDFGDYADMAL